MASEREAVEPLGGQPDRAVFTGGVAALDRYRRQPASPAQRRWVAVVVLVDRADGALAVDAKDDAAQACCVRYGFHRLGGAARRRYLPMITVLGRAASGLESIGGSESCVSRPRTGARRARRQWTRTGRSLRAGWRHIGRLASLAVFRCDGSSAGAVVLVERRVE